MLDGKAVKEVAADVLQKGGGTRDKVWYAGLQLPDLIIRVTADVHQLVFSVLRVLNILYRHDAKLRGRNEMRGIGVRSTVLIAPYTFQFVIGFSAFGIEEIDGFAHNDIRLSVFVCPQ